MPDDWEANAIAEVRRIRSGFQTRLAEIRARVESHGGSPDAFFAKTALFDGPCPAPLRASAFAEGLRMFDSPDELLRSVVLPAAPVACELGVWKGDFPKRILRHLKPATLHLHDLTFDRLDPAVVPHAGDSRTAIAELPDATPASAGTSSASSRRSSRADTCRSTTARHGQSCPAFPAA